MTKYNVDEILEIAEHHLKKISDYDPYYNFQGVNSKEQFAELISKDPAFSTLGLDNDKYVIARIGGNLITSMHRKIGDMYEAIFQYLLKSRFGLSEEDLNFNVTVTIGNRQQIRSTDGCVPIDALSDVKLPLLHVDWKRDDGLAFEVRSCYQIGDSKRIQADWDMALALKEKKLTPIMLIFCNTSLKSPIIRLRSSWNLYEGEDTFTFIKHLTDFDLYKFMQDYNRRLTEHIKNALSKF